MYGDGAAIAWRLKQEGHNVALRIIKPAFKEGWSGILPKLEKWDNFLDRDTVVVFDSTGGGRTADRLRQQGYPVFGASVFADNIELDRQFGIEIMERCGIKVPESHTFNKLEEGQKFAQRHKDKMWVFKPSGAVPAYLTYVPSDKEDMIAYFDLQEYKDGIAISTEAWCDGTRFVPPYNHTIEKKRFANSDLGPSTGCVGNVCWSEHKACRTVKEGIALAEEIFVDAGYIGCIDLNTIVNQEGVWGLEWTPRFGYDAISVFMRLLKGDLGKIFSDFARSQYPVAEELPLTDNFAGSVRLTIPPAPDEQHPIAGGTPLRGFAKGDLDSCYFYEVMVDRDGYFVHSGGVGTIVSATGVSTDFRHSLENGYRICEAAKVPNKQYRTDLTEAFSEVYNQFIQLGG
jgi:phosphoribosylamine--glycine ligase